MLRNHAAWHDLGSTYLDHPDAHPTVTRLERRLHQIGCAVQSMSALIGKA